MLIKDREFLLGCDPEVFVVDGEGRPVPAHGLIPGTKDEPFLVENGMVQVDGLALEFGIDPSPTKEVFFKNIQSVLKQLTAMLPKGLFLHFKPVVVFNPEDMKALPPEALELGCDPDYNAYTLRTNPRPVLTDPNMRSAGGHVHIGWGAGLNTAGRRHIEACAALSVELDLYLGVASLRWDTDSRRRAIYGKPGAFRPKRYGMEYRSLSNQWLNSKETIEFVFDSTIKAIEAVTSGKENSLNPLRFFQGQLNITPKDLVEANWSYLGEAIYDKLSKGETVVQ